MTFERTEKLELILRGQIDFKRKHKSTGALRKAAVWVAAYSGI